jgi:hypothetical protein
MLPGGGGGLRNGTGNVLKELRIIIPYPIMSRYMRGDQWHVLNKSYVFYFSFPIVHTAQ